MPTANFLICLSVAAFLNSVVRAEWYTSLEFIFSVVAVVVYGLVVSYRESMPQKEEVEELKNVVANMKASIEEVKTTIGTIGTQVKNTTTKLSGLRMQIGIKD